MHSKISNLTPSAAQLSMANIKENERDLPYHLGIEDFDAAPKLTGAALELILGLCVGQNFNGYGAIDLITQTCHELKWGSQTKRASDAQRYFLLLNLLRPAKPTEYI